MAYCNRESGRLAAAIWRQRGGGVWRQSAWRHGIISRAPTRQHQQNIASAWMKAEMAAVSINNVASMIIGTRKVGRLKKVKLRNRLFMWLSSIEEKIEEVYLLYCPHHASVAFTWPSAFLLLKKL
jgi:hypothetical protein